MDGRDPTVSTPGKLDLYHNRPPLLRYLFMCRFSLCGGDIQHDPYGHINWQCRTCGRWTTKPAPPATDSKE